MKPYKHNSELYRAHFAGGGAMPVFRGRRTQRGRGKLKKLLKRYAVPLVQSGVRAAAPHAKKLAGKVATSVVKQAFAGNPAMQRIAGDVAGQVAEHAVDRVIQKKRTRRTAVRPKKKSQEKEPNDALANYGTHRR